MSTARAGSAAMKAAMAPYRPSQAFSVLATRPVGASCQGPRASTRRRSAGEPAQNSPAGTTPSTSEPGATSASLPTEAPGLSVQRAPTRARAPTEIGADVDDVAVDPVPARSTSGSIAAPLPR